eukprot:3830269-Rhodomonas_salina.4
MRLRERFRYVLHAAAASPLEADRVWAAQVRIRSPPPPSIHPCACSSRVFFLLSASSNTFQPSTVRSSSPAFSRALSETPHTP